MTYERYRAWLQLLVDGNQNMARVWGGGIYEYDEFYEVCDGMTLFLGYEFSPNYEHLFSPELGSR